MEILAFEAWLPSRIAIEGLLRLFPLTVFDKSMDDCFLGASWFFPTARNFMKVGSMLDFLGEPTFCEGIRVVASVNTYIGFGCSTSISIGFAVAPTSTLDLLDDRPMLTVLSPPA